MMAPGRPGGPGEMPGWRRGVPLAGGPGLYLFQGWQAGRSTS